MLLYGESCRKSLDKVILLQRGRAITGRVTKGGRESTPALPGCLALIIYYYYTTETEYLAGRLRKEGLLGTKEMGLPWLILSSLLGLTPGLQG